MLQPVSVPAPHTHPFVRIVEQPSPSVRYRYSCEGRPGTIPGASSTSDNKLPFAIQIVGHRGRVMIVVSCVTEDRPYRTHPHNLVGHKCKKGVCYVESEIGENDVVKFPKIALQCVRRNDVPDSLKVRRETKIDPFKEGFAHQNNVRSINLNVVRLCVQVFLREENTNRLTALDPVVSNPIHNKKTLPDPIIHRLSHCNSYVDGRDEDIILLCTKISKDDIRIRFFEIHNGELIWEDYGSFHHNHIYNQSSICFRPPMYHNQDILVPAKVLVQLVRPSDGLSSPNCDFEYLPLSAKHGGLKERRKTCPEGNPLFAQLLETCSSHSKVSPPEESEPLLVDISGENFFAQIPLPVNNLNQTWRNSPWNITEDFCAGPNINVDSASGVCQILNMDCNQIQLEPLNINSGDLEMADINRLSGSLQHLAI